MKYETRKMKLDKSSRRPKPLLQPLAANYSWQYLARRWFEAYGNRPSKRRLKRRLAKLRPTGQQIVKRVREHNGKIS